MTGWSGSIGGFSFAMAAALAILASLCAMGADAATSDSSLSERALLSAGDAVRLEHVFAKARRGEEVTVSVIGGSITQGAMATKPEYRYGDRIAAWWRETFPKAKIEFVNAGIGATGSDYGCQRAERDLLSHHPDFVVVEYGVNDGNDQSFAETYEGLIRQILKRPQKPAVVLLYMMNDQGGNAQEWQSKVGTHYLLPMISYRDALWPEIQASRMPKSEIFADLVHPNDRGHEWTARLVTDYLEKVYRAMPEDGALPKIPGVPKPLFTDLFESARLYEPDGLKPLVNKGWTLDAKDRCWKADQPGSVLEFETKGRLVFIQSLRLHAAMGRVRAQVDDRPPMILEGWFDQTWGGWHHTDVIARDLPYGTHRVRLELLEEKHPESGGHEFKIYELGAAGARR